jgi:alpha-galactosidase
MTKEGNHMKSRKKITFVGAGSIVFTKTLLSDLFYYPEFCDSRITLMDIDKERLEMARLLALELKKEKNVDVQVSGTLDLREALKDADYVINVVQIGGKESTYIDFDIPEKYGLKQTIADTHGICGMMRFLRSVPHLHQLCTMMTEICPHAFLLNFTNPMSMCQWYVNTTSDLRTIGLCHSIPETINQLAAYMRIPVNQVNYLVAGINHMAWVLKLERNTVDLYPELRKAMQDRATWERDPVRFEIMKYFGYYVTESSEHMAEYVPYFLKSDQAIKELKIPVREYIARVELNEKCYLAEKAYYLEGKQEMKGVADRMIREFFQKEGKVSFDPEFAELNQLHSREYAAKIMHALETGEAELVYGIVPNNGMVENLDRDCMVDGPVYVDRNGIHPLHIGKIPSQLAALNQLQINMQRMAVQAAVTRKKDCIYHAALIDPLASAVLSLPQIRQLTDDMLAAHKRYMPEFS